MDLVVGGIYVDGEKERTIELLKLLCNSLDAYCMEEDTDDENEIFAPGEIRFYSIKFITTATIPVIKLVNFLSNYLRELIFVNLIQHWLQLILMILWLSLA
jgi:hypothetical protein